MLFVFGTGLVSRYAAVPGSDGPPSNPRHQPSFDKCDLEPFRKKR